MRQRLLAEWRGERGVDHGDGPAEGTDLVEGEVGLSRGRLVLRRFRRRKLAMVGLLVIALLVLLPLILAYTAYSYWVFRGKVTLTDESY